MCVQIQQHSNSVSNQNVSSWLKKKILPLLVDIEKNGYFTLVDIEKNGYFYLLTLRKMDI